MYYCKICVQLDEKGISGHHTRCGLKQKVVVTKPELVANAVGDVVANKHGVYRDKERRLAYMRELMRKKRHG